MNTPSDRLTDRESDRATEPTNYWLQCISPNKGAPFVAAAAAASASATVAIAGGVTITTTSPTLPI